MKKLNKKKIARFIFGCAFFYFGLMALLYSQQRSMMYFPGGARVDLSEYNVPQPEFIPVQSNDDITFNDAWYWPAKKGMPTIAFFHGNGQAYLYWVKKMGAYISQGYGVYFTDYRGFGGASGKPTEQGIYNDARAHLRALEAAKGIAPHSLIYYGESLGTGVVTQMATEFPPIAIIYESAYSATSDVAKARFPIFPIEMLMKDQYRSIDKVSSLDMPKLFVHGTDDKIIPIRFGKALYDAAPTPKKWVAIENSGHNNLYDNGVQLHISSFLSTLIEPKPNQ